VSCWARAFLFSFFFIIQVLYLQSGSVFPLFLVCWSFPSPLHLCQVWPLFPLPPPSSGAAVQASCQTRPTSSLSGKSKAQCDVPCAGCGAIFSRRGMSHHQWHYQAFRALSLVVILALWLPFLPLLPLLRLGC
jgi:hypothetical protein